MQFTHEEQRERWKVVMDIEFMSSEESGMDEDEEVIMVKCLPWRSDQVNELLKRIDDRINRDRSSQARRQVKKRISSLQTSSRAKPGPDYPAWLFKK